MFWKSILLSILTGCMKTERHRDPPVKLHGPITWKSAILKFPVKGVGGEERVWYVKIHWYHVTKFHTLTIDADP
jgi:hypothetical protein